MTNDALIASRRSVLLGVSVLWIPLAFLFDGVTVLVLPIRLGADPSAIGLTSAIGLAVGALVQPAIGWFGDRVRDRLDRRLLAAIAAIPAIAGLWALVGSTGVVAAVGGYLILQVAAAGMQASQQTLIPEHVDGPARGRAAGLKAAFDVGGSFLAFGVLGALLATGDLVAAAVATSVVLVSATVVMLATTPGRRGETATRAPRSVRPLDLPPGLRPLIAARFLFLVGTYVVGRFLVLLVADRLAIPVERAAADAGGLLALLTIATAAAAIVAGWLADRGSRRDLMAGGSIVAAAGIAVLAIPAGIVTLLAGGLLMSAGTAAFVTANWAETTALVPAESAGRLMGIANLGTALAAAAAGLAGPLIASGGFAPALVVAATATVAAIVPILVPVGRTDSARSQT